MASNTHSPPFNCQLSLKAMILYNNPPHTRHYSNLNALKRKFAFYDMGFCAWHLERQGTMQGSEVNFLVGLLCLRKDILIELVINWSLNFILRTYRGSEASLFCTVYVCIEGVFLGWDFFDGSNENVMVWWPEKRLGKPGAGHTMVMHNATMVTTHGPIFNAIDKLALKLNEYS